MSGWEYKVVPAPKKGVKGPRIKGAEGRFANAIETLMNQMGAQGWEYLRAENLPSIERSGLTGSNTEWRNLLVFRRAVVNAIDEFEPELLPSPEAMTTLAASVSASEAVETPQEEAQIDAANTAGVAVVAAQETAQTTPEAVVELAATETQRQTARDVPFDNGVEDIRDMGDMTASLKELASQRLGQKTDS